MKRELVVDYDGMRLDLFLARRLPALSRTHLKGLVERGAVLVDGRPRRPDFKLTEGQEVVVELAQASWAEQFPFEQSVLHEDRDLLVLDKPAGLLIHPLGESWLRQPEAALSEAAPNLAGILLRQRPDVNRAGVPRCGIVHRLDRQTSGVLLVAKTVAAYQALTGGFKDREIHKVYRAIVRGAPPENRARVEAPVGRNPGHRRVVVTPFGKSAETAFEVIERCRAAALVEAEPLTGRTHQIRAHLAALGHPVCGDPEFEAPAAAPAAPRLMLHAYRIEFAHPKTGKPARFSARLPKDFREFWKACRAA